MRVWTPNPDLLELLDTSGGPFDTVAFRRTWTAAYPSQRDVSYGAEMSDGTGAAIALLSSGHTAESMPLNYGGIIAGRRLFAAEVHSFLHCARRAAGARWITAKSVPIPIGGSASTLHIGARVGGWTSVVYLNKADSLERRFAYKVRRSIRRAREMGAEVDVTSRPDAFLTLYASSSQRHWYRYPDTLIRGLAQADLARFFDVRIGDTRVASVMALIRGNHWTAWLAAQNEKGRSANANYLAVSTLLHDAEHAGLHAVNLGISTGMPGVAHFKRRFDSIDVPVFYDRIGTPQAVLAEYAKTRGRQLRAAVSRRVRRLLRTGRGTRRRSR